MNHRANRRFWAALACLPEASQRLARKNYRLLRQNPRHPSLHFKEVKPRLWSVLGIGDWLPTAGWIEH
ncbi:MAG: hypothetical protein HY674_11580 [Chloroflexi bacterium]|nr:hypothetical protein [Chloroflexota bacterium]